MGKFTSLIVLSFLAISCAQTKVVLNNQKFKAYKQYSSLTSFPMGLEVMSLKERLYFLDALRAFAILMMLQGHFISGVFRPCF